MDEKLSLVTDSATKEQDRKTYMVYMKKNEEFKVSERRKETKLRRQDDDEERKK